ncbi:MAG: UDP-N-acetylmuramate--L-alanine ligase [Candidatus Falkowbacteria bacterium]|nr:UDP-N-acetylmuramate--L-alanine ligase [Candidatus Falkowbacteria bacterium]
MAKLIKTKKNKIKKNIYFIGIKGAGMTMLAQFLAAQGHQVSGSDIQDSFLTDKVLKKAKIKVLSPFAASNIPVRPDLIIYSSAYNEKNNPEMAEIKKPADFKNIPVLSYAAALGRVFNEHDGVAVCGSHGKTTTSAWLGYVLMKAGQEPNVLVGSRVPQFSGSSLKGSSPYLIAEVDEYQNKLQYFRPIGVVLNNIDYDHPDYFKTAAAYTKVFADFIKKISPAGFLIINGRDQEIKKIKKYCRGRVRSYDLAPNAKTFVEAEEAIKTEVDYLAYDLRLRNGYQIFKVASRETKVSAKLRVENVYGLGEFKISLWGEHNALNALAVLAAARELKVSLEEVRSALASFTGTERRAQILGKYHGALIIDDYAHHPTEIAATLKGLCAHYPDKNIITVFHPHTFTRTKEFFHDFVTSFTSSDELIILDIYGSARESAGRRTVEAKDGISSRQLVVAIDKFNKNQKRKQSVKYLGTIPEVIAYLRRRLTSKDTLLLMGAGDVFRIGEDLLKP